MLHVGIRSDLLMPLRVTLTCGDEFYTVVIWCTYNSSICPSAMIFILSMLQFTIKLCAWDITNASEDLHSLYGDVLILTVYSLVVGQRDTLPLIEVVVCLHWQRYFQQ